MPRGQDTFEVSVEPSGAVGKLEVGSFGERSRLQVWLGSFFLELVFYAAELFEKAQGKRGTGTVQGWVANIWGLEGAAFPSGGSAMSSPAFPYWGLSVVGHWARYFTIFITLLLPKRP